jgi:hypothetical protein
MEGHGGELICRSRLLLQQMITDLDQLLLTERFHIGASPTRPNKMTYRASNLWALRRRSDPVIQTAANNRWCLIGKRKAPGIACLRHFFPGQGWQLG